MATLTYSPTTAGTDLVKLWKKIQGPLAVGFNSKCEEWGWMRDLEDYTVNHSAREVIFPVDITPETAGAAIPEGGKQANPITTAPQEATLTFTQLNKRFTVTHLAQYLDKYAPSSQIEKQMKYEGKKLLEGLCNYAGRQFYGFSTGIIFENATDATATSGTAYTIRDGYDVDAIDTAAFLAGFVQIGDRVGLLDAGSLVSNGIGTITAKSASTPSITVTWIGSVDADVGDDFVFANSVENTTIAGTDYNRWLVGLLDGTTSTSVHSLSGSTYPLWTSYQDTSGGRFDLAKLRAGQYAIQNNGGGKLNRLIVANGVLTDMTIQEKSAVRWSDAMSMEFDGAVKVKGTQINTSRKVPPGYAFGLDDRKAVKRWNLTPMVNQDGSIDEDGPYSYMDHIPDTSADVFSLDQVLALAWQNRSCAAVWSALIEA